MYFQEQNKLTFGPEEDDPAEFAEKLQAIAYVANGCFEGDISDVNRTEENPVVWCLSDHIKSSEKLKFNTEKKIIQAFKKLDGKHESKQVILERLALKYHIDESDKKDEESEGSVDIYLATTEDEESLYDDENTILNKDKHYFGKKAKDEFWTMYKSGRTFKDHDKNNIQDPRLAYLKTCYELKMLPKAGMVIRGEKTTHLSFANFGLLHKNSMAVAESLKRYPLEIHSLDFSGNGIRSKEWIMLVESLEPHANTLLQLNFSENRIGFEGAEMLGKALVNMKQLEWINLASNLLGDLGINEILIGLQQSSNLREINFSNNWLGQKQNECEFVTNLGIILSNHQVEKLDLSWNNLRGEIAESFIKLLKDNYTLKYLDLSYNLFGVSTADNAPAAIRLADILQENSTLEELNLSNNLIESKIAFCLAYGLRSNTNLKSFIIDGNPIGSSGVKFLIQSINNNEGGKVENIKMRDTETIIDKNKQSLFDPMNVEGEHSLDLDNVYDRITLYHLLDIDEKIAKNCPEDEGMQQGDCFLEAKLGSSSWVPPNDKDKDGRWNLGPEPSGTLKFRYSLDPKRNQKPGPKDPELPKGTLVDSKGVSKPVISDVALEKSVDLLIRLNIEESSACQREMINSLAQEYYFTYLQASELLKAILDEDRIFAVVTLFNRIVDRHFRYDLIQTLSTYDSKLLAMKYLAGSFTFNYFNPTDHYKLRLANPVEREIALTLLMFNRKAKFIIDAGEVTDRSKYGNKSWFRNEKLDGVSFVYDQNFILPHIGILEWDFVYLISPPLKESKTSEEKLDMIKDLLQSLEGNVKQQIKAFKALSEYLVLSSRQLSSLVDLIDDPTWKSEWYIAGIGRMFDQRNFDFIKKKWKYPESSRDIYNRFGIYNLFNPHKCTGSYRLDLEINEERCVWQILLELTKVEGYQYMTNVTMNSKPISEITAEFEKNLPREGIFEGSYVPPEDAANNEARERIGKKYFNWSTEEFD